MAERPYIRVVFGTNELTGTVRQQAIAAFAGAADRWNAIIRTQLNRVTFTSTQSYCSGRITFQPGDVVDGIVIRADLRGIDGVGSVLGSAGACVFSTINGVVYPRLGVMTFDTADVANLIAQDTFNDVILHEMGHIIGIGGSNAWQGFLNGRGTTDPEYDGPNAVREYRGFGGVGFIDAENTGGGGTREVHWRTSTFGNELMTGFLQGQQQRLSAMTIGSLVDLGYQVDLSLADSYSIPNRRLLEEESTAEQNLRAQFGDAYDHLFRESSQSWEHIDEIDFTKPVPMFYADGERLEFVNPTVAAASPNQFSAGVVGGAAVAGALVALAVLGAVRKFTRKSSNDAPQQGSVVAPPPSFSE